MIIPKQDEDLYKLSLTLELPAPLIVDPLKDVLPVARAPSRFALLRFAYRKKEKRKEKHHKTIRMSLLYIESRKA